MTPVLATLMLLCSALVLAEANSYHLPETLDLPSEEPSVANLVDLPSSWPLEEDVDKRHLGSAMRLKTSKKNMGSAMKFRAGKRNMGSAMRWRYRRHVGMPWRRPQFRSGWMKRLDERRRDSAELLFKRYLGAAMRVGRQLERQHGKRYLGSLMRFRSSVSGKRRWELEDN